MFDAIARLPILLIAGLALDSGHMMLNKTRLQNTVDAAALSAAKVIDETGDTTLATAEAMQTFANNAASLGNAELATAYGNGSGSIQVVVEFSATLPPFAPGAAAGPYVRVTATGFVMPAWLIQLAGVMQKTVTARAVAGPRTLNVGSTACNLAPMMVCGNPAQPNLWGYALNSPVVLKAAANGSSQVGPGNFQLIQLGEGNGAAAVRENMAGSYDACIAGGNTVQTQTGNEVGPVTQGLNTRFGDYRGPMNGSQSQYPPDVIVDGQSPALNAQENADGSYSVRQGGTVITSQNIDQLYNYQDYTADLAHPERYDHQPTSDGGIGAFDRRVLAVPVGDCSTTVNGTGSVPLLGFACFFLLQPAIQQGNNAFVYGQFVQGCQIAGTPGPNPVAGTGPNIIQLYHSPGSEES
ncbi:MAG: pilus assembly protein TadG-related protein [Steroidobacteraceae bacterium]